MPNDDSNGLACSLQDRGLSLFGAGKWTVQRYTHLCLAVWILWAIVNVSCHVVNV